MTAPVKQLLDQFNHLTDSEQAQAASTILRKTLGREVPPITGEDLTNAADELFSSLDDHEAGDADS